MDLNVYVLLASAVYALVVTQVVSMTPLPKDYATRAGAWTFLWCIYTVKIDSFLLDMGLMFWVWCMSEYLYGALTDSGEVEHE